VFPNLVGDSRNDWAVVNKVLETIFDRALALERSSQTWQTEPQNTTRDSISSPRAKRGKRYLLFWNCNARYC